MRNFQEKRRYKQIMRSKPVLMLLGIIIVVFAWSIFGLVGKMQETIKNKKIGEDKVQELQTSKEKLSEEINKLQTEKGIEENIRKNYDVVKDGEGMIVVVEDKNLPEVQTENKSIGFFSFFKSWFK